MDEKVEKKSPIKIRKVLRPSTDENYWDCSVCTYRNGAEAFKCAMCDVRKGTSRRTVTPTKPTEPTEPSNTATTGIRTSKQTSQPTTPTSVEPSVESSVGRGAIAGIIIGTIMFVLLIAFIFWFVKKNKFPSRAFYQKNVDTVQFSNEAYNDSSMMSFDNVLYGLPIIL
ncbi:YY1-associated factor 2 [Desmophyllum pertusum]|uniref:YY1-associated factor 2 n=1 Tax=Desmophyllum pertusum TaxID=174260 RepID=A0A9W9ZBU6_9CNID|nr:YY1-associated factor 2 [Desmophyllum pertusum]